MLFHAVFVLAPTFPWNLTESGAYTLVVLPLQSLNCAICVFVLYAESWYVSAPITALISHEQSALTDDKQYRSTCVCQLSFVHEPILTPEVKVAVKSHEHSCPLPLSTLERVDRSVYFK